MLGISAFAAHIVPIYIGCTNITDYFDPRGMLIAKDVDDVLAICRTLTPETYAKMLPFVKENAKRAKKLIGRYNHYIQEFYNTKIEVK